MSRAEDDEIERTMAANHEAKLAREARTLPGTEVKMVREALRAALHALGHVNTKSLPFARRMDVETARRLIQAAQPIVAWRAPRATAPSEGPTTTGGGG